MNKLSKNIFLMLGLSTVFSICDINFAMGAKNFCDKVGKGNYCFERNSKPNCPRGCYCPGSGGQNSDEVKNLTNGLDNKTAVENACKNKYSGVKEYLEERGVFYCPAAFPYSDKGKNNVSSCYATVTENGQNYVYMYEHISCEKGKYLDEKKHSCSQCYGQNFCPGGGFDFSLTGKVGIYDCEGTVIEDGSECKITCDAGTYIAKGTRKCSECKNGHICKGESYTFGKRFKVAQEDIGIEKCADGTVPNQDKTECISSGGNQGNNGQDNRQNCADGYYNSGNNCVMCTAGYYCENGVRTRCPDGYISTAGESSCTPCDDGESSNSNHTRCVKDTITVVPGKYLPKNSSASVNCYGTYNYCPGGFFEKNSDKDQGIYKCPLNGVTTNNGQSCKLSLSKSILENGDSGEGDCWKITSPSDYKRCVFGKTMVDAPNTANRSKSPLRETSVEKAMAPSQATAGK